VTAVDRRQPQREQGAHREADHRDRSARGEVQQDRLGGAVPVAPAALGQLLGVVVTGEQRGPHREAGGVQGVGDRADLGRCAGEAVDQQDSPRTVAEDDAGAWFGGHGAHRTTLSPV
jgi:hypothetical protein